MDENKFVSNARAFFNYINDQKDPFHFLSNIPNGVAPFFEEEWLDFKGEPQDDNNAKKIWSKALSGYANITDGLIIWGIDAREDPTTKIDAASGLRLISNAPQFESKLRDWIRDATNPPVMAVEYSTYIDSSNNGFVVCLVPESNHKPHRAEYASKQYYYRAGDDFLPAEPSLLRVLFYPQAYVNLSLIVTLKFTLNPQDLADAYKAKPTNTRYNVLVNEGNSFLHYDVTLTNVGSATARDAYAVVETSALNFYPSAECSMRKSIPEKVAFLVNRPIYPDDTVHIFSATFQRSFPLKVSDKPITGWELVPNFDKVSLKMSIFAENMRKQQLAVEFDSSDLSYELGEVTKNGVPIL